MCEDELCTGRTCALLTVVCSLQCHSLHWERSWRRQNCQINWSSLRLSAPGLEHPRAGYLARSVCCSTVGSTFTERMSCVKYSLSEWLVWSINTDYMYRMHRCVLYTKCRYNCRQFLRISGRDHNRKKFGCNVRILFAYVLYMMSYEEGGLYGMLMRWHKILFERILLMLWNTIEPIK